MTAVSLPRTAARPAALHITPGERLALRAADALAGYIHRRAVRRDARLLADLARERAFADARLQGARAMAYDVPRMF